MKIYKELVAHEVFPALGCTEPIVVAYAAAIAAAQLEGEVKAVRIEVDPGVFKNGFAVTVPNTGGEKGNLIAGALGALIARPELKMEVLKGTDDTLLARAKELVAGGRVTLTYDDKKAGLYIDVTVKFASDARMAGLRYPAMASGGSGNQGIVASLVPYTVGRFHGVPEVTILKGIALSHLVNGYIKCYTGNLSPICGCAIAAGVGAAVAIVYQRSGKDLEKINLAVNTLVSDLGGMLCDGAKGGCALKVVSSTESAIRAAYMALNGHGITEEEGFVGRSAEETIKNRSRISEIGMSLVDETMLGIMLAKKR